MTVQKLQALQRAIKSKGQQAPKLAYLMDFCNYYGGDVDFITDLVNQGTLYMSNGKLVTSRQRVQKCNAATLAAVTA